MDLVPGILVYRSENDLPADRKQLNMQSRDVYVPNGISRTRAAY
jgi:hypothetical protein